PRTLDGTTLHDHVIRHIDATAPPTRANPNPRPEHHLTVYTPDERAITYDARTGHFINNTDGTPGLQRVNDVEYLLLTPEHRAIPVQQLTESTTSTRPTPPDPGDTDLTVHMAFIGEPRMPGLGQGQGGPVLGADAGRTGSFDIPVEGGAELRLTFAPDTGRVTAADAVTPDGGQRLGVTLEPQGDVDIVRVTRDDGTVRTVRTERWIALVDSENVPRVHLRLVDGQVTAYRPGPDGSLTRLNDGITTLADGSGSRVLLPGDRFILNNEGVRTHDVVELQVTDSTRVRDFVDIPTRDGGQPQVRDLTGEPRGFTPEVTERTITVPRGAVTTVYDRATGVWQREIHAFDAASLAGHDLRVPNTVLDNHARPTLIERNTGQEVPNSSVDLRRNGHTGALEGEIRIVRDHSTAFHDVANGDALREVHRLGGDARFDAELNGADLVVPAGAADEPRLVRDGQRVPDSGVTKIPDEGFLVRVGDRQALLDLTGRPHPGAAEAVLPDGTTGLVLRSTRPEGHAFFDARGQRTEAAFTEDGGTWGFAISWGGGTLTYRFMDTPGGGHTAQLTHETYRMTGGPVAGRTLEVTHADNTSSAVIRATGRADLPAVEQRWAGFHGYRIPEGNGPDHSVITATGGFSHRATPLVTPGTDAFVHLPATRGGGDPLLRRADGTAHPATEFTHDRTGYSFTNEGITRQHETDGRFIEERFTVTNGELPDHVLRLPGNLDQATITPPGTPEKPVDVTVQRDNTLRVHWNTKHVIVDPATRTITHDVRVLTRTGPDGEPTVQGYAFTDLTPPGRHTYRTATGDPITTIDDITRPGSDFATRRGRVTEYFDGETGAHRFDETALAGGEGSGVGGTAVRIHEMVHEGKYHRAYDLLDNQRAVVPDRVVTGRQAVPTDVDPGTGFRVRSADGSQTWAFHADGGPDFHIGPRDPASGLRTATKYTGQRETFQVRELGDSVGQRFADARTWQVRDRDLNRIGHQLRAEQDGEFRGNFRDTGHATGLRDGEYKIYGPDDGRLIEQRINIIAKGRRLDDHFYKVVYEHDDAGKFTGGIWERWRPNPEAARWTEGNGERPPASIGPPTPAPWLDRGRVEVKGADHGHVSLVTFNSDGLRHVVFERRPLADGAALDGHTPGTVTDFAHRWHGVPTGFLSQRERWQLLDAEGNAAGNGIRIWGTSRKTFFDYGEQIHVSRSLTGPVHHYRETPDGGYVLATREASSSSLFSFSTGQGGNWHRYGADFSVQANGERRWYTGGHGWIDRMPDPRQDLIVAVNEKFAAVALHKIHHLGVAVQNIRNFRATELSPGGLPTGSWTTVSPQGKPTGVRRVEPDGSWDATHRIAEQRPPNFYRTLLSPNFQRMNIGISHVNDTLLPHMFRPRENRYLATGTEAAFIRDSRLQAFNFESGTGAGTSHPVTTTRGVEVISSRGWNTVRVPSTGQMSGETRGLANGNTLTVGDDVKLPQGMERVDGLLPWTEGAGKLSGHRTFDRDHFVDPPTTSGKGRDDVQWQDQFRTDVPAGGNWYTREVDDQGQVIHEWHVARMGFKDGTILDHRPRPGIRAADDAGNGDIDFQRTVHAGDTWRPEGRQLQPDYLESDWVLTNHHGKLLARQDTFPGLGPDGTDLRVHSVYTHSWRSDSVTWTASDGSSGVRKLASRNDMGHHDYFDRESFRDFVIHNDGRSELVREVRLLADNTTDVAWKVPGANGAADTATWRWNKIDRHGNIMAFGTPDQRIRHWSDDMKRWEDRIVVDPARPDSPYTVVQELPSEVGGALRRAFNRPPLRVREYFADPAHLDDPLTFPRTSDGLRGLGWKEFESGAVARRKTLLPDGTYQELESMAKHWRRWAYDDNTGTWKVLTERSIAGFVRERPAASFLDGDHRFEGDLGLVGRETYYIGLLNEYRGFERMLRQPRRASWGPGVTATGESTYTPFAVRNSQHMLVEFLQELVLDFTINMAVYAAMPGEFTGLDVLQALLGATIGSSVKSTFIGLHNLAANHSQFRLGLTLQDRGFPYRFRQDDDDMAGEWGANESVLRWRGGTYDFFKDGFLVSPLSAFVGGLAGFMVFGVRDNEGIRHEVTFEEAAAMAGASAGGAALGTLTIGGIKGALQGTAGARWYHRQGPVDFTLVPIISKLMEKPLGFLEFGPIVRDSLGIVPPTGAPENAGDPGTTGDPETAGAPSEPPPTLEFTLDFPVLGPTSPYPHGGTSEPDTEIAP
ncbi:hypothetical protein, partial [Streptomyces radicis]